MEPVASALATPQEERRALSRVGAYIFSYLLAALLLVSLIHASGVWNFLANTRLLDLMIRVGIVEYHDEQTGFIRGIPDLDYFLKSQDPIKWGLVELAAFVFFLYWILKAVQFHALVRFCGIRGTFTQHARAYLEGIGVNRLLPYDAGNVRMAAAFQSQGAPLPRISQALFLSDITRVLEIVTFALVGLALVGWSVWIGQLIWPLVILLLSYFLVRPGRKHPERAVLQGTLRDGLQAIRVLSHHPLELARVGVLSLFAFGFIEVAAYIIAMAFTSTHVILHVGFPVLLMGVVGGAIAQLIPVSPGGIGQFEWGMAAALYIGGLGLPECVAIAVLTNVFRYVTGTLLLAWVYILRVDYSFEVLKHVEPRPLVRSDSPE